VRSADNHSDECQKSIAGVTCLGPTGFALLGLTTHQINKGEVRNHYLKNNTRRELVEGEVTFHKGVPGVLPGSLSPDN